jgi:hypothetical protein
VGLGKALIEIVAAVVSRRYPQLSLERLKPLLKVPQSHHDDNGRRTIVPCDGPGVACDGLAGIRARTRQTAVTGHGWAPGKAEALADMRVGRWWAAAKGMTSRCHSTRRCKLRCMRRFPLFARKENQNGQTAGMRGAAFGIGPGLEGVQLFARIAAADEAVRPFCDHRFDLAATSADETDMPHCNRRIGKLALLLQEFETALKGFVHVELVFR